MKIIGLKEFKENPDQIAQELEESGEEALVVKRSRPLFWVHSAKGVEERWEPVADFTRLRRGGVDIDDLLTRL